MIAKHTPIGRLCARGLRALGWKLHDKLPEESKFLAIVAPHTSNWDFPLGIAAMLAIGLPPRWIGKHTLFRWPIRWFFEGVLGGIPVDRRSKHDFVKQIVELFRSSEELVLVMAPEGTRKKTDRWKTGFYWIAHEAGVPIMLTFYDWDRKELGTGPLLWTTGDIEADFEKIRRFYSDKGARHPERTSTIATKGSSSG